MNDKRNKVFDTIRDFLKQEGWKDADGCCQLDDMGQVLDPITYRSHDIDFALCLQLERDRSKHREITQAIEPLKL